MKKAILAAAAVALWGGAAYAVPVVTILAPNSNNRSPFTTADLGTGNGMGIQTTTTITSGNETISFQNTGTPNAGVYSGGAAGVAASPYGGTGYAANRNYVAAEAQGNVTINFNSPQSGGAFDIVWGSPDGYNTLSFYSGSGSTYTLVGTVTGAQVLAAGGSSTSTAYVQISGLSSYNRVVATSTQAAFEFDPGAAVPEPASLAVLGLGLAGLGVIRRKKANS